MEEMAYQADFMRVTSKDPSFEGRESPVSSTSRLAESSGGGDAESCPTRDELQELVPGKWFADQKALADVAAEAGEVVPLLAGFDALGDDSGAERVGELDRSTDPD
jgi:hypothetical protein